MRVHRVLRRVTAICLMLLLTAAISMPPAATAQEGKVVRVGWYDMSFCYWDEFGRRSGIDYEYQQKISAYTGWTYEYVEDSWPNLLQKLMAGEIDLLGDVSYKPERTQSMFFSDLPMGNESYYIYVAPENRQISANDLSTFNGRRIGVNAGSVQESFLREWVERNGLSIEVVPLDIGEDQSMDMLTRGELDGYATIYTFNSVWKVVPVIRIGGSEFFYAVSRSRPDLLAELNAALSGIQDEDAYFTQMVSKESLYATRTNVFLTPEQEDWLRGHGPIRIGYRDDYLPFCQFDRETGALTGALKDYLAHAINGLRSSDIQFETAPYPTTEAALEAMREGKVDCVFPVYLHSYDADSQDIRLTSPAMKTEMNAVMRASDSLDISRDSSATFAVSAGSPNTDTFIMAEYPASVRKTYEDKAACYSAVASGEADYALISNYRLPAEERDMKRYNLLSAPTGETMPLSFAVKKSDRELYFILNKTVAMTRSEEMGSALASYMHAGTRVSFTQFLRDNWIGVIALLTGVFFLIVVLLLQKLRAERRFIEQQRVMEDGLRRELQQKEQLQSAMDMAYRDPLTGVKSKHAFKEAETRMDQRIAAGDVAGFSVVVFDLNDLKLINDSRGHEIGDQYIKDACKLICTCFKHSPVYRIGGDEFTAILEGEDYANQEELLEKFEKQVLENLKRSGTVVAFGSARFNPHQDRSISSVFERADATMYKEKSLLKSFGAASKEDEADQEKRTFDTEDVPAINVRRHILIADDMESNREILGDLLEEDYDIIYASDGREALEILHNRKDEIALLILDLYMPNMSGQEVIARMQVDEDLMSIPVIVLTVDQDAELNCLKMGAMDFIPKPYPDIEIVRARIAKCIELSENRDLIRRTQRDRLTGLFNISYFLRYVNRYDQHCKGTAFDALLFDVDQFHRINEQYGRQFGDLVLRSIGISVNKLARKTGGIGCRKEDDTFLIYCPHREDYDTLLKKFTEDLFVEKETASKVTLRIGVFPNAQREPDIEERFACARMAADSTRSDPGKTCGYYEPDEH